MYGDGAYVSLEHQALALRDGITIVAKTGPHMNRQNSEVVALRAYRSTIEAMEKMGGQRLHAVTQAGFGLKVYASLLALAIGVLVAEL